MGPQSQPQWAPLMPNLLPLPRPSAEETACLSLKPTVMTRRVFGAECPGEGHRGALAQSVCAGLRSGLGMRTQEHRSPGATEQDTLGQTNAKSQYCLSVWGQRPSLPQGRPRTNRAEAIEKISIQCHGTSSKTEITM